MEKNYTVGIFKVFLLTLVLFMGCKKDQSTNALTVTPTAIYVPAGGSTTVINIETDAASWQINNPSPDWAILSSSSGTDKKATVSLSVSTKSLTKRVDTLTVSAGNATPVKVVINQTASLYLNSLSADKSSLSFESEASSLPLTITTDAAQWNISSDAAWLQTNLSTGAKGSISINVNATENQNTGRNATLTLTAANSETIQISVTQKGSLYPNYNTSPIASDATGMSSDAVTLASKMHFGWNIGNTLEAIGGETVWGNPKVTKDLITFVKSCGFNAIRIPCSWNQYSNTSTGLINADWMNRVKEIVQYCVDNDMYVMLNIHWDGGWLENNCTTDKQVANNAKQKAFWQQIATALRDFDEHLLFASANEPNVANAEQMGVLLSYHQTFIKAVRSTGGRNTYRNLIIQGPSTDIDKTNQLMGSLPTDPTANRMLAEVHYYTPYQFCGLDKDETWGKMFYFWGKNYHSTTMTDRNATWGEEADVDKYFASMKTKFVDKGIPVIIGEFGAMRRSNLTGDDLKLHLDSRAYYLKYVVKQAKANGLIPFYWDAGGNNSFSLINRTNLTVGDQQALDAMIQGLAK